MFVSILFRSNDYGFKDVLTKIATWLFSSPALFALWGLFQNEYEYQVPDQTDDGWETSSLANEGVDPLGRRRHRSKNYHYPLLSKIFDD